MLAAAVAARALALNHEPEQARAALTAADAFMSRLPEADRSDTWLTYGEQKHHVHLSHAFTTRSMTRTLLNIGTTAAPSRRAVARSMPSPRCPSTSAPVQSGAAPWTCSRRSPPSTNASRPYGNYATS
ncbi:hypothetical protein ACIQWB_32395 [Streptomyces olivaceus]|uniref:hypothetical protein n=1 Tax=Streptomyces olivaceus TaxID=47716 RepID=UPI00382D405E